MLVVTRDEFQSHARARLQQMDITAESSRKFNKVPQKIVADSEKLQNYKIHQRNEKELLYLAGAGGNKERRASFPNRPSQIERSWPGPAEQRGWYALPLDRSQRRFLSLPGEFPIWC